MSAAKNAQFSVMAQPSTHSLHTLFSNNSTKPPPNSTEVGEMDEESTKTPRRSVISNFLSLGRANHGMECQSPAVKGDIVEHHVHPLSPEQLHYTIDEMFADEQGSVKASRQKIRDVYVNDEHDDITLDEDYFDSLSVASSSAGSFWPAYHLKNPESHPRSRGLGQATSSLAGSKNATSSSSSLRSWGGRNLLNRSSTGINRKSVCHTLFAGFKSIRKSLAAGPSFSKSGIACSSSTILHTSARSTISPACPSSRDNSSTQADQVNGLFLKPDDDYLLNPKCRKSSIKVLDPTGAPTTGKGHSRVNGEASLINLLSASFRKPGRKSSFHHKPGVGQYGSMLSLSSLGTASMSHIPCSFLTTDAKGQAIGKMGKWRETASPRISLSSLDHNTGSAIDLGSFSKKAAWAKMANLRVKKTGLFFKNQGSNGNLVASSSNIDLNPGTDDKENVIPAD
ncbi:hypothetical protein Ciccas_000882 [Cichlidogyrus casuarinus]|uniref:Uncharacterized protein n=1 Tax=Cichlidogyrus casuarinus TaxID=1844966 RepID=A0ABD2QLN8_9PLAT